MQDTGRPADIEGEYLSPILETTPLGPSHSHGNTDPILPADPMHASSIPSVSPTEQTNSRLISPIRYKGSPYVYKRRQSIGDLQLHSTTSPDPSLEIPYCENSPNISNPPQTQLESTNLDLPITIRKGVITCSKHPLANYLSSHCLSPIHKSFLTSLDAITIPKSVEEAVKIPTRKRSC